MNKRRLLKLADLLEADAKNKTGIKFDLGLWGQGEDGGAVEHSCGTTACAIGLAIVSGAFKCSGLENYFGDNSPRISPAFDGVTDWTAVERFFSIKEKEAYFLFFQGRYPPDKQSGAVGERYVAKRIRDFVAGKAKPAAA
jgi:hypothetical protein